MVPRVFVFYNWTPSQPHSMLSCDLFSEIHALISVLMNRVMVEIEQLVIHVYLFSNLTHGACIHLFVNKFNLE